MTTNVVVQSTNSTVPIQFEDVPIKMAIGTLAGVAKINYLLDPQYTNSFVKTDGSTVPEPTITVNLTNLTAMQALTKILKEHNLSLVEDPVTSIAEIKVTNRISNPVDATLLDSGANGTIPVISFYDVPLDEALKNLVQRANVTASLDPKLSDSFDPATHRVVQLPTVYVRWENVTARQAIIALCKNYNLTIVKDQATGVIRIKPKD